MFHVGIFAHAEWKSRKATSSRPCIYRNMGNGFGEVFPASTNAQLPEESITVQCRGFHRKSQVLLDYRYRKLIPLSSIKWVACCPAEIAEQIEQWEAVHTV